jgi:hypothetical protein
MKSRDLVKQLQIVAHALKQAAQWKGSRLSVNVNTDYYVYELLCYFKAAHSVASDFKLTIRGTQPHGKAGKHKARWPKSPGNKTNFSYIDLVRQDLGRVSYQICPGINIADKHGKNRAPDINLLKNTTSLNPKFTDMYGCWDAKYQQDASKPLVDTNVSDFAYTHSQLGSPTPPQDWTAVTEKPFEKSGLLTNAGDSTEPDLALASYGILETSQFPTKPKTRP